MTKPAGWSRPLNSKKHHYFEEGSSESICGKWLFFGGSREPDTFESPDDCAACRKKLNKAKANGKK